MLTASPLHFLLRKFVRLLSEQRRHPSRQHAGATSRAQHAAAQAWAQRAICICAPKNALAQPLGGYGG